MGRYDQTQIRTTRAGKKYLQNTLYPEDVPTGEDIYVITVEGDRLDKLAWDFYKNIDYWWIIAVANPEVSRDSLALMPGLQLRIPAYPEQYLVKYQDFNK